MVLDPIKNKDDRKVQNSCDGLVYRFPSYRKSLLWRNQPLYASEYQSQFLDPFGSFAGTSDTPVVRAAKPVGKGADPLNAFSKKKVFSFFTSMADEILEIDDSEPKTLERIQKIMVDTGCGAGEFTFGGIASVSYLNTS
jgi:hypothetical protein